MFNHSGDISADTPDGRVFTEADWGDTTNCKDTFFKSKCLAERAAWDFVTKLPGNMITQTYVCSSYMILNIKLRLKMIVEELAPVTYALVCALILVFLFE